VIVNRSSDNRDVSDVMMCGRSGTCGTSEWTGVWQWQSHERGGPLNDICWERNEEARKYERQPTRKRRREVKRRERGKTVGLVTRCVLLLLYGGLLHHQNIKCPVGKRACAWVHPHFTFTADCRLNQATFPRFLAPENVLVRLSRIFPLSRPLSVCLVCSFSKCGQWLPTAATLFLPSFFPLPIFFFLFRR